jgi:glucokinase
VTLTIGVDIGGTKILGGVVDPQGTVLAQARRPTPAHDPIRTRLMIIEVIHELIATHSIDAIGIGAAGWIDESRSTVLYAPNLAWRDEPLREEIARSVDAPVIVENDANAAAWAEFRFGAGRSASDSMVLLALGTGVGGGIILDGQPVRGSHGISAELGHVRVVPDGYPCGCGRRGCLEQYASGSALVRCAQTTAKEQPDAAERLLGLAGGDAGAITGLMVTQAAQAADPAALSAFDQVGYWLGHSMADLVQVLDPEVIVLGGGVADAGELLLRPARTSYRRALAQRAGLPVADVRRAELGNVAGVVGASDLARQA